MTIKKMFSIFYKSAGAVLGCLLLLAGSASAGDFIPETCRGAGTRPPWAAQVSDPAFSQAFRARLQALWSGYCQYIDHIQISKNRGLHVVMKDGTEILFDDGKEKDFNRLLNEPDLNDMFHQQYTPGTVAEAIKENHDPGRFRNDAFLKAIYGRSASEVRAGLVPVDFVGKKISFNKRNGAADRLAEVSKELTALVKKKPGLKKYIAPMGGTFNWRVIAGTKRLSPHSYGMAVDLNAKYGGYWRWSGDKKGSGDPELRRKYPAEIVAAFEKHGFIWGGKWYHFDLMHFEYRPELLLPGN